MRRLAVALWMPAGWSHSAGACQSDGVGKASSEVFNACFRTGAAMIIRTRAFARAGLVGNPSDGYYGKTISFVIRNFATTVTLWESPHFEIVAGSGDLGRF